MVIFLLGEKSSGGRHDGRTNVSVGEECIEEPKRDVPCANERCRLQRWGGGDGWSMLMKEEEGRRVWAREVNRTRWGEASEEGAIWQGTYVNSEVATVTSCRSAQDCRGTTLAAYPTSVVVLLPFVLTLPGTLGQSPRKGTRNQLSTHSEH